MKALIRQCIDTYFLTNCSNWSSNFNNADDSNLKLTEEKIAIFKLGSSKHIIDL